MHYQNSKFFKFIKKIINLKSLIEKIGFARAKYIIDFLRFPTFVPMTGEIEVAKEYFSRNDIFWQFFSDVNQEFKNGFTFSGGFYIEGIENFKFFLELLYHKEYSPQAKRRKYVNRHLAFFETLNNSRHNQRQKKYKAYEVHKLFKKLTPNLQLLRKLIRQNQKEYLRKRLRAIKMLWEGKSRGEVEKQLSINPSTLLVWLKIMVENGVEKGLKLLAKSKTVQRPAKLSLAQQLELLYIIQYQSPNDFGYYQNIFTGEILIELVNKLWGIKVCNQTIYNILARHKFSYQRGHRDYDNANPEQQLQYVKKLKKRLKERREDEVFLFFDEFSLTNRGTIFYGWARRNTRFIVRSNERNKRRLNGFLSVSQNGELSVDFYAKAESIDVANYLYNLVLTSHEKGYRKIVIVLDNCPSHKQKMRLLLSEKMKLNPQLSQIEVEFINTPAYSPDFNLAEYLIHQLRLQLLHHLPCNTTLDEVMEKIKYFLQEKTFQTPKQIKNTINHIFKLGQFTNKLQTSGPFTEAKGDFLTSFPRFTKDSFLFLNKLNIKII